MFCSRYYSNRTDRLKTTVFERYDLELCLARCFCVVRRRAGKTQDKWIRNSSEPSAQRRVSSTDMLLTICISEWTRKIRQEFVYLDWSIGPDWVLEENISYWQEFQGDRERESDSIGVRLSHWQLVNVFALLLLNYLIRSSNNCYLKIVDLSAKVVSSWPSTLLEWVPWSFPSQQTTITGDHRFFMNRQQASSALSPRLDIVFSSMCT